MPSNKEPWTLPLPPNLAPLQCARALPAASTVALAAARRAAELARPPLLSGSRAAALRLARPEARAARGRGAQDQGGVAGGCGGAFSCANPAPRPRPRGPAPRRAEAASLLLGDHTTAFPLGVLRGTRTRARWALTHCCGGGDGRAAGRGGGRDCRLRDWVLGRV